MFVMHREWGHTQMKVPKRKPYIFARYNDPATGKVTQPELGRWLLEYDLPVVQLNGDPLDWVD